MTNYYENLDAILTVYRMNYLNSYSKEDYVTAAQMLYDRNAAHPPDAFLADMPKFVIRADTLKARLGINNKAKQYCDFWNPRLEVAMAHFRNENQEEHNKI